MTSRQRALRVLLVGAFSSAVPLTAESQSTGPATAIGSVADERMRLRQARGDIRLTGSLLRSTQTLSQSLHQDSAGTGLGWSLVSPELRYTYNSDLSYSLNDGALWAGRGSSYSILAGARAEWGPVRLFVLPEFVAWQNQRYDGPDDLLFPPIGGSRSLFSAPWHFNPQSIDLPTRFGDRAHDEITWGQSSISADIGPLTLGASTENEWWGPGIRNALILSNNAPGFPKLFLRTARPVRTRFGDFEGRWLSGWLTQSGFFSTSPKRDVNSISMMALTWQPPKTNLVLGAARAVWTPEPDGPNPLGRAFMVFNDVGQPNAWPVRDPRVAPGPDQLLSLFWRWVFPRDGFEFWGEWGRAELPVSLRDFLVHPNHTQGYTLGLQWLGEPEWRDVRLRVQSEATFVEQSTTFRQRLIGSWYTSRAVDEGYTHRGQVLGAAIGPGSSSQFVALGAFAGKWNADAYVSRIRWQEDARSQRDPYPGYIGMGERGACEHDVSFLPGIRASALTRFGDVRVDYSSGWRLNVFFTHPSPCWQPLEGNRDVRNKSLSITFTPANF